MSEDKPMVGTAKNTDQELWREIEGDYYSPSIHVTTNGLIGINVGGLVCLQTLRQWHELAKPVQPAPPTANKDKSDIDERAAIGDSWCDKHQLRWPHRVAKTGCPLCEREKKKNPTPPTDSKRPNVDRIRLSAKDDLERISGPHPTAIAATATIIFCDYTLDLERRLKTAKGIVAEGMERFAPACSNALIEALKDKLKAAEEREREHDQIFDLFHACSTRAIKRWQKETGKKLTAPDGADLYCWLMDKVEELEKRCQTAELAAELQGCDEITYRSLLAGLVVAGRLLGEHADEITGADWRQFITASEAARVGMVDKETPPTEQGR